CFSRRRRSSLRLSFARLILIEPGSTRGVSQSIDPAMIKITAPIEHHAVDARGQRARGNRLSDLLRRLDIAAGFYAQSLLGRRSRRQRLRLFIIDELRIDVIQTSVDRQPRARSGAADFMANTLMDRRSDFCSVSISHFLSFRFLILDLRLLSSLLVRAKIRFARKSK